MMEWDTRSVMPRGIKQVTVNMDKIDYLGSRIKPHCLICLQPSSGALKYLQPPLFAKHTLKIISAKLILQGAHKVLMHRQLALSPGV